MDEPQIDGTIVVDRQGDLWKRTRGGWVLSQTGGESWSGMPDKWFEVQKWAPLKLQEPKSVAQTGGTAGLVWLCQHIVDRHNNDLDVGLPAHVLADIVIETLKETETL